jgi:prefoldin alpha subunit
MELDPEQLKALEMQLVGQNLNNLKNQIDSIAQQIVELEELKEGLLSLKDVKDRKSFIPFGSGVFLESELKQPKEVLMNVGSGVLVKKDFGVATDIIGRQITELKRISFEMSSEMKKIESQFNS